MEFKWGQIIRFFTVRLIEGLIVLLLIMFMPNIPPYCKISDSIVITSSKPLEGKLALNQRLNDIAIWHKGDLYGPEAFADYNGELYTSIHSGEIVKLVNGDVKKVVQFGKPCKGFHEEKICGRPLGIQFDKDGNLYAVDSYYGIYRVNIKTGEKVQLVSVDTEIGGKQSKSPNSLAVTSDGDVYWSDSSTEFLLEDGVYDMFSDGSGRLIHYDSKTKKNTVLIDDLIFANGVALSDDEEFVLISETGRSRILRYYIKGPKKGNTDVFIDGLPGHPDNINHDGKGGFLIPLIVARDDYTPSPSQILGPFPLFRKLISRMMGLTDLGFSIANRIYQHEYFERAMHLVGHFTLTSYVLPSRLTIIRVSKTGEIIDSLHANNRKAIGISEAYIFKDELYLGSPFNDFIARVPLSKVGWEHLEKKTESKDIPTTTPKPKAATTPTSAPTKPPPSTTTTPPPTKPVTTKAPTAAPAQKKETAAPKPTEAPKVAAKVKPIETQKAAPKTESAKPTPQPQVNKQEAKPTQASKPDTKPDTKPTQPVKEKPQSPPPPVTKQEAKQTQPSSKPETQQSKPTVSQTKPPPPQQKQTTSSPNKVPK